MGKKIKQIEGAFCGAFNRCSTGKSGLSLAKHVLPKIIWVDFINWFCALRPYAQLLRQ